MKDGRRREGFGLLHDLLIRAFGLTQDPDEYALVDEAAMMPPTQLGDNLAPMICGHEWLPIGLALSLSALACSRTPMDEHQVVTPGTTGGSGGAGTAAASGGNTATIGGAGGIAGAGGNKCATDQNTCATDDDCIISFYRPPILSPADCYCFECGYPVANAIVGDCQNAYDQFCGPNWEQEHVCGAPPCRVAYVGCIAGMCQYSD